MSEIDAIRVHVRLSNNALTQRRMDAGWTREQLAAEASHHLATLGTEAYFGDHSKVVSPAGVATYERLRRPPRRKDGEWKRQARAIAAALGVLPEDLWPPVVEQIATPVATRTLSERAFEAYALAEQERRALPAPDEVVEDRERRELVAQGLAGLTPRDRGVIEMRFGLDGREGRTRVEVGRHFGVGRDRIGQIEARALRKLRHSGLGRALREAAGLPDYVHYPVRTCQTLHHCAVCDEPIMAGERYHDGGYNRRAHTDCAMRHEIEQETRR